MGETLNILEAITAGRQPSKRVFHLLDAVILGSDTEACLAIRRNRIWLRRRALGYLRRLRRQAASPPDGLCREDIWREARTVVLLIRSLQPAYLKWSRGLLTGPARCRV